MAIITIYKQRHFINVNRVTVFCFQQSARPGVTRFMAPVTSLVNASGYCFPSRKITIKL